MQSPMDSCVCGINMSSESVLIRSYLLLRDKHIPVELWYTYFTRNENLTNEKTFWPQIHTTNVGMHSLLHDIPRFFILFLKE